MKRKLIQMAGKTMVVSLPADWVKKYNLKKGDEIELNKEGKLITISIDKDYRTENEISINLPAEEEFLERMLHINYILGYDQIKLSFEDKNVIKQIKQSIKNLLGFEIIQETQNTCVIKSVTTEMGEEFDNVLRRIFFSLISIGKESYELIKNQKYTELKEELSSFEDVNDKLTFFCERLLNKKGYKVLQKTTLIYCIVWTLEQIGDEYRYIAEFLAQNKKIKLNNEILSIYSETNKLTEGFYNLFYKSTPKELRQYRNKINVVKEKTLAVLSKTNTIEKEILYHLASIQKSLNNINVYLL